ncbi:MAG: SLBB domain-containing protein, partial [Candidatus Zixiibacteriota bacterium]
LNNPEAAEYHIKLQDRDSVHIYSIDEIERRKYVYIGGEVENPGKYDLFDGMRLSDLIFLAGNPKRAAYLHRAELAHTDSLGEVSLTHIDLTSPMIDEALLQEDDQVYIRQIPEWSLRRRVAVEGDVYFPGEYMLISKDETLWSLLQRAGGFTPTAFPAGLVFDRGSISHSVFRRNLDRVVSSSVALIEDSLGNVQRREDVIYDADNLNRIIVDVPRIVTTHGAEGDVVLQHGDRIFIPCIPSGISVLGAVGASGTIKFEPGKKSRYYLERAGGYTRQADEKHVKLVKADGRVFTGSAARKQIVDLGDAIVVPTEIKKERNFMKSLSSMISVVSGLATSVFIITKL